MLAWQLAKGEAAARQRVSRVIGFAAASRAEFTCFYRAGKLRFALAGSMNGLSDEQLERLGADVAIIAA